MADEWLGKEMLRQGELRLASQAASLTSMESRATNLLAFCGAALIALGAAVVTAGCLRGVAAGGTAVLIFAAAAHLLLGLKPVAWGVAGLQPAELRGWDDARRQDAALRVWAKVLDKTINRNKMRLDDLGRRLWNAVRLVLAAPFAGGAAMVVAHYAGQIRPLARWLAACG